MEETEKARHRNPVNELPVRARFELLEKGLKAVANEWVDGTGR